MHMPIVEFLKMSNKRNLNKNGNYGFKACSTRANFKLGWEEISLLMNEVSHTILYLTRQVHYLKPTYSLEIYLFMTIKSNIVRMTKKDGNSMGPCNFSDLWRLRLIYFLEQVACALFGN
jgi:hypothetical protein